VFLVNHKHKQLMIAVIIIYQVSKIDVYIELNLNTHVTAIIIFFMYSRSILKTSQDKISSIILFVTYVLSE